jgi:aspartate-semialdehyde dehydrogenase
LKTYDVAVVGATGAVGQVMLRVLEQRAFPVGELVPLASSRSVGKTVEFRGKPVSVRDLASFGFEGVDVALFSAGASVSLEHAPRAAAAGAVVIDNTSAFRMDKDVPLVVPEVNPGAARDRPRGIIANPNCSTIQMVVALEPIRRAAGLARIVVATYQSVSGAGNRAIGELKVQARTVLDGGEPAAGPRFPHVVGFNCLPQIDVFLEDGYTKEERKMMDETRKIMGDDSIRVSATCVRVPVLLCHAESVNVETVRPIGPDEVRELLRRAPGVVVVDDPGKALYPLQRDAAGTDPVYVGRIRKDPSCERGLDMWIVADNLRKGAALNAVQVAEVVFGLSPLA